MRQHLLPDHGEVLLARGSWESLLLKSPGMLRRLLLRRRKSLLPRKVL